MKSEIALARLCQGRLVVVARRLPAEHIFPVAETLIDAGVAALEITVNDDPSAVETIAQLRERFGEQLLIGAGTVLSPEDAEGSLAAGAHFVVSPVLVSSVLTVCSQADALYFPGAIAPTHIFEALTAGVRGVKLFPASLITPAYVHDVLQPFRAFNPVFMLTGGLDNQQIPEYLAAGISIVGVGGAILDAEALSSRRYEQIGDQARSILHTIQEAG
ncbi:MAG TPA: bifunctional 4-hydroxy-2-oxoglutarate aldolase/2-dehydro-3-deoxy-phosphogluconate aldolase [Ktedonobacterales bacterium]|nr:bifunctional 4-hydroxy-2-oxoglutarate aldolase/2-dehydro-3-deoxy-phosphogluconate aldolase [Ktedonobacterales bacterium]